MHCFYLSIEPAYVQKQTREMKPLELISTWLASIVSSRSLVYDKAARVCLLWRQHCLPVYLRSPSPSYIYISLVAHFTMPCTVFSIPSTYLYQSYKFLSLCHTYLLPTHALKFRELPNPIALRISIVSSRLVHSIISIPLDSIRLEYTSRLSAAIALRYIRFIKNQIYCVLFSRHIFIFLTGEKINSKLLHWKLMFISSLFAYAICRLSDVTFSSSSLISFIYFFFFLLTVSEKFRSSFFSSHTFHFILVLFFNEKLPTLSQTRQYKIFYHLSSFHPLYSK